jgi:poly(glycerol-phosphate) alpha-glucosyltransferase
MTGVGRSSSSHVLPEGGLYALTFEIAHRFGGLTKAMLQRSGQFAAVTGRDVVVMTVGWEPELDDIRASVRERGLLADGVSILNLWEDLEEAGDDVWASAPFDPTITTAELESGDDRVLEIRRPDGSVRARQLWRRPERPVEVLRTEIIDRDGRLVGGWNGSWPLWRWWLARVLPTPAHLIVDSAYVASCLAAAPLPGVPTTYVMHNNHISQNRQVPYGRIERWRSFTVPRSEEFDAAVYLTSAQRHDIELLRGTQPNAHVVPNAFDPPTTPHHRRRPAGRGIVMSLLVPRKRIQHAVRAVAAASKLAPDVDLTIYGSGPDRERIESTIDELSAPVRLEGYTKDPASAFASSSFMLLTSIREGLPLVLAESMTAGCLPIAYDLAYGPSDIVRDGVDGYVVPVGDVAALAARIGEIASMSRRRLRRMRKQARRRAKDFTPAAVIPRWGPVLEAAAAAAAQRPAVTLSHAQMTELERVDGLHRMKDCRLEATVVDLTWDRHGVATLLVSCAVVDAEGRTGRPRVDIDLVHRPTGKRFEALPVEEVAPDPADPAEDPTTTVRVTLDAAAVGEPADHVLLVQVQLGDILVLDTVGVPDDARGWLPMPPASPQRPVLLPHRREGLRLVMATPHVAASVALSPRGAELEIGSLEDEADVETVEAKSLEKDGPSFTAERLGHDKHRLDLPENGRWKLRARVGDRWRDVAWRGPEPVPDGDGPVRVELTPRGYVRLRRDA